MQRSQVSSVRIARRLGCAAAVGALMTALSVHAQTTTDQTAAAPAKPAPASSQTAPAQTTTQTPNQTQGQTTSGDENTTVTVVGQKPPVQHKVDRDVYDVSKDPQAQTGSASDVLSNVPSVTVDNQGNVSLRGNAAVQIYVNGKPSAEMQGDNRATALQAMSGGDIDSVEVITNPSAQFGADTSGGIINLVTKRNRRPGFSGTTRVNIGNDGRYRASYSSFYTKGPATLSVSINGNHDDRVTVGDIQNSHVDPITGQTSNFSIHNFGDRPRDGQSINVGLDYNLTDTETLTLGVNSSHNPTSNTTTSSTMGTDQNGNPLFDYGQVPSNHGAQNNGGFSVLLDHRGKNIGEDFKVQFKHSESSSQSETNYHDTYTLPAQADDFYRSIRNSDTRLDDFSGDLIHPIGDTQALAAGWDMQYNQSIFDNFQSMRHADGSPEIADTNLSNRFELAQLVTATYVTFNTKLGTKWTLLAGLRAERTDIDGDQVTSAVRFQNHYLNWAPSLHLSYPLGAKTNLRLSYSHKIRRPNPSELNPFIQYRDAFDESAGNPILKPQQLDNYEANITTSESTYGLYYNRSRDTIASTATYLPGNIVLTTQQNVGRSQSAGLEYQTQKKLSKSLSLNFNANVFYQQLDSIDPFTLLPVETKGSSYTTQTRLSWSPTTKDAFQVQANFTGPQLQAQGTRTGFNMLNLSYVRTLNAKWKFYFTDSDALNSMKFKSEINSSRIHSISSFHPEGRTIYIGLSYNFGGAKDQENGGWRGGGGRGQWGGGPGGGGGGGGYQGGGF